MEFYGIQAEHDENIPELIIKVTNIVNVKIAKATLIFAIGWPQIHDLLISRNPSSYVSSYQVKQGLYAAWKQLRQIDMSHVFGSATQVHQRKADKITSPTF